MASFAEGQRVRLLPNEAEGWNEEYGTVIEVESNDMYVVELDEEFAVDEDDDLIREVEAENMEPFE